MGLLCFVVEQQKVKEHFSAKLQDTEPLISVSLNNKSSFYLCVICIS